MLRVFFQGGGQKDPPRIFYLGGKVGGRGDKSDFQREGGPLWGKSRISSILDMSSAKSQVYFNTAGWQVG